MRIIAGTKRGMNLLSPRTRASRPITDRVKESLFSVLYKYDLPEDAVVADLFCGVGSLGLEALSRGAQLVVFVEQDKNILITLRKNIEKAGFIKESTVIRANAFRIADIADPSTTLGTSIDGRKYDLVFVDPPYASSMNVQPGRLKGGLIKPAISRSSLAGLLEMLGDWVTEDGVVVVRTALKVSLQEQYGRMQVAERRQWGSMAVTILIRRDADYDGGESS
jgi:16S rRNA (guanine966-N2)-methyltransferase